MADLEPPYILHSKLTLQDTFSTGGDLVAAGTKSGELRIFAWAPSIHQLHTSLHLPSRPSFGEETLLEKLTGTFIVLMQQHHNFQLTTFKDVKGDGGRVVVYTLDTSVRRGPASTLPPPSEKEDLEPVISGMKVKVIVVGYLEHSISAYYVHHDNTVNVANLQLYWTLVILASCGIELYATNPVSEPDIAQYGQLVSATGLQHKNRVLSVGFLADGQWLVYGSGRGNTFIINHNTSWKVEILNDHDDPDCLVFSLATWANDDKGVERIVAGTRDGWDS
ncbi:hypothetical protein D9758_019060 [Tetrapyrgos nigripes]|uniref:Uncharacterized protein n=1 Tax=Tetrapyrgos nigripes TaxID=182062 RepID=A0A8H5F0Z7_9AGAR|nr:hypothetical protein D9758_019060 [Tetrapyrgos nigripes]